MSARPRLGRGLAALLGEQNAAAETGPHHGSIPESAALRSIPVDRLEPGPYQPRTTLDGPALEELVASVRARGVLQPILARPHPDRPGSFQIVAGERRWRAAGAAGLAEVPVLVRPLADHEALASALVENLQRHDLNVLDEAEGYRRLLSEFGMTQEELAQGVGKSRSHVANTMRLLNLPNAVQAHLRSAALSAGHARALLSHPEPERAAVAVIARGLSVRQTEALANSLGPAPVPSPAIRDPDREALERELSEALGLRVAVERRGREIAVVIRCRTDDQLEGVFALLKGGMQ